MAHTVREIENNIQVVVTVAYLISDPVT